MSSKTRKKSKELNPTAQTVFLNPKSFDKYEKMIQRRHSFIDAEFEWGGTAFSAEISK